MTSEPNIGNFKEPIEQMAEETKDSHEVTCEHNIGEIKKLIKQMAEEPKDSHEENATYEKLKSKIDEFKGSKEALDLQPKGSEDTTEPASETQNKPDKKNATCDKLKCLIDKFKGCKDTTEPATKTQNKQEEALKLQLKRSEDTTDPATETQNKQEQKNATCKKLKSLIDKLKESKDTTKSATKPLNKQEEAALDLLFYMMKTFKFWSKKEMEIVKRLVEKYPDLITKQPLITKQHESQRNGQTPRPQADCTRNTGLTKQPLITKQHESQRNGQTPPSQAACTCKTGLTEQPDSQRNGQTPLHLAVCKGNTGLIELFLSISSVSEQHGEQKSDTVKVLLDRGAPIDGTNNLGDNVCHSLIRYASLYPEKVNRVRDMFVFLEREIKAKDDKRKDKTKNDESGKDGKAKEKDKKKESEVTDDMCTAFNKCCPNLFGDKNKNNKEDKTKNCDSDEDDKAKNKDIKNKANDFKVNRHNIWKMTNNEDLTPLQLAAKCGQHELFKYIMDSEIYCYKDTEEGLFDIKNYDIQEIDAISWQQNGKLAVPSPENQSVLKILLKLDPSEAFQFILIQPVYQVINKKWAYYIRLFGAVWTFFLLFTGMLIWYCIERSQQEFNSPSGFDISAAPIFKNKISTQPFLTAFSVISTVVALILLCLEIYRCYLGRLKYSRISFTNPYSHGCFRATLVLISILLILDLFAATLSSLYENYCLLVAVILVCFCNIFFIRVIEQFSFSTALFTKVIVRDMIPFFVILAIESIAFSTAMYMAIQGSEVIDDINYSHYGRVLFSMATLMVGLGDTADFYDTRHAGLTIAIFIAFVIFTTLLMINSLIAMISKTCTELFENVRNVNALHLHWCLQITFDDPIV